MGMTDKDAVEYIRGPVTTPTDIYCGALDLIDEVRVDGQYISPLTFISALYGSMCSPKDFKYDNAVVRFIWDEVVIFHTWWDAREGRKRFALYPATTETFTKRVESWDGPLGRRKGTENA